MGKIQVDKKQKEILDSLLLDNPEVSLGKMFGYPAYYVGGKMFASFFEEGVCVKVPENVANELMQREGIEPFYPRGRRMREWVLLKRDEPEDFLNDKEIFQAAIEFVSSLSK